MNTMCAQIGGEQESENRPRLVRVSRDAPLPVSFAQEAFLSYQTSDDKARNVLTKIHQIVGPLDVALLRDCLNYIARRHEIFRTTFGIVNGQAVQIVHPAESILLSLFEAAPGEDPRKEAARIIKEETSLLSDLTQGPLIRFSLLHIDENKHWLFRICQHLLWDGWSTRLFLKEFALLYEARSQARPAPLPEFEQLQYADYASWQRKILRRDGSVYQEAIAWWKNQFQQRQARLKRPWQRKVPRRDGSIHQKAIAWWKEHRRGEPAPLELPFKRPAPCPGLDPTEGAFDLPVDLELEERLNSLSRNNGTTLFVVWLAGLVALLAAETGQSDIIVGTYMSSRSRHPALHNKIGCFAQLVALRFQCDPASSFSDWLSEVQSSVIAAKERCEISYNLLHGLGVPPPELRVVFQATMGTGHVDRQFAGLELFGLDLYTGTRMPWGFRVDLLKSHHQICRAYFDAEIYDPVGVRRFLDRLCELLSALARNPRFSIGTLVSAS